MKFSLNEQKVIDYAREELEKKIWRFKSDNTFNPGCFILSNKGNIYHGIAFDDIGDKLKPVHAEVVAIATMFTEESPNSKIKVLLIIAGKDNGPNYPCRSCLDYIKEFSSPKTIVFDSNLYLTKFQKHG